MSSTVVPPAERPGFRGAVRRQWPWLVVIGLVGLGLLLIVWSAWRIGVGLIGGALVVGGLLRWWLAAPGLLAVRRKAVDVPLYLGLGITIIVVDAIATIPLGP